MKIRLFFLAVVVLFATSIQESNAQTDVKYNTWSVYLGGGQTQYYGDIARASFWPGSTADDKFSWNVMAGVNKTLNPIFGLNAYILYGTIHSQKQPSQAYIIQSNVLNYGLNATMSFSNLLVPKTYNKKLNFYGLLGVTRSHYRTLRTDFDGNYVASRGYENSDLANATESGDKDKMADEAAVLYGMGVKYRITDRIAAGLEITGLAYPSDKFDSYNVVLSENDRIGYTNLMVQYTLGNNAFSHEWNPEDPWRKMVEDKLNEHDKEIDSLKNGLAGIQDDVDLLMDDYNKRTNGPDQDGDGVLDYMDQEPNTPKGAIVNWQGITLPIEKDQYQKNPDGTYKLDANGNPIRVEQKDTDGKVLYSVFFALNSTYVNALNHERIAIAANLLKKYPDVKLDIVGSACEIASDEYNQDLSMRRANVVRDILVNEYGIDASRLNVKYDGESKPLSNKRLFINRRVDLFIAE